MTAITSSQRSSTSHLKSNSQETKTSISKNSFFGKRVESLKNSTKSTLSKTALKIQKFVEKNYINVIFAILSISALLHGPYRFLFASILGLGIQKINYKANETAVTSLNLALNILGVIGIILEKTICPICDPSYYLAPCISGIATSEAIYNLYRSFSEKTIAPTS